MKIQGRWIAGGLVGFAALFAGALWYAQTHAFYEEFTAQSVVIDGVAYEVSDFAGIDASTSPLKLRACFRLDTVPEAPPAPRAEPLVAPGWFECFDARTISEALASGEARAFMAQIEEFDGADRIVVRLPDGRAYMWRQLNEKYAEN